jgi:succinate dehydrogenase / fumarate reductase flavoprotein subunit
LQEALDVANLITVARTMVASAAARMESRGVHHRIDHPDRQDNAWLVSVVTRDGGDEPATSLRPVQLTRAMPEASGP